MTSESMGRKRFSALSEGCEPLWLLHMEAEYVGFMVSIESEIRLLEHIRSCRSCKERLIEVFTGARDPTDELEEAFAPDLLERMGADNPTASDCPRRIDYIDSDAFTEARVNWRLKRLRKLLADAELELGYLSKRIKEEKSKANP